MKLYLNSLSSFKGSRLRRAIVSIGLLLCAIGAGIQPAHAEGSRELVGNGGHRPYTEWRKSLTNIFLRRTVLKVFAKQGEVINLGSSAVNVGSGNILLFPSSVDLYQEPITESLALRNCRTQQSGTGFLSTRAQELAGPLPATGGYTPCTFTAPADGIYQVAFYGPDGISGDSDPGATPNNALSSINSPLITAAQGSTVSMWDITVRSSTSTTDIPGRVFTDHIALNMDLNGRQLNSDLYILTQDGYQYRTALNGLDPFGFIFFANAQGLLSGGQPIYRSGQAVDPRDKLIPSLLGGVVIEPAKHKLFFTLPNSDAIAALGYSPVAIPPLPAQNFLFTGAGGGSGNQTFVGVGGTFSFDAPQSGNYQIIIDVNNDGVYSSAAGDRILEGSALLGSNTVVWDGKNGNGVNVPALPGNAPYNSRIILKGGEYHFPMIDAEGNANGFSITMLNPPGSISAFSNGASTTTVYYDDRDYQVNSTTVSLNCPSTTLSLFSANPCDARTGIDSTSNGHRYGKNPSNDFDYGDGKVIDTWIYFPSAAIETPLVITPLKRTNVKATKSVRFLTDVDGSDSVTTGDQVQYTITYSNLVPSGDNAANFSDAINFVITDTLPTPLTYTPNSAVITSQTTGNTMTLQSAYNGSGALTNAGTLRVNDSITITLTATINSQNSGNPIANQASATFGVPSNTVVPGTVITDANSSGSTTNTPTVGNFFQQADDDTIEQGNDSTIKGDDEPTLFNVVTFLSRLRLVKRITRINTTDIPTIINPATTLDGGNDDAPGWQANYLRGAIDGGTVRPADEVEYTIYFLSDGGSSVSNVDICDLVPTNSTFIPNSFSATSGVAFAIGSSTPTSFLTNTVDADGGQFLAAPTATPVPCNASNGTNNPNGAIIVRVGNSIPSVTADPVNSYGFIRFRARVNGDPLLTAP
jgi:fimbrial isopeptide formation D2 family protein/uncharacterized repeat protein (TIGR01451 family)